MTGSITTTESESLRGSVSRGIAAGALACIVAIPVTPVVWLVCSVMKRVLYHKVMHREITLDELHRHGTGTLITNAAVGGTTGLVAAAIAAWAAMSLVKGGNRWSFLSTAAIGFTISVALLWRGMTAHGDASGSAPLSLTCFLLLAIAGLGLTEAGLTTPDKRASRR